MENDLAKLCEFSGCYAIVSKRVRFGVRVSVPEVSSAFHELDVCDEHLAEITEHFLFVSECVIPGPADVLEENAIPKWQHASR